MFHLPSFVPPHCQRVMIFPFCSRSTWEDARSKKPWATEPEGARTAGCKLAFKGQAVFCLFCRLVILNSKRACTAGLELLFEGKKGNLVFGVMRNTIYTIYTQGHMRYIIYSRQSVSLAKNGSWSNWTANPESGAGTGRNYLHYHDISSYLQKS